MYLIFEKYVVDTTQHQILLRVQLMSDISCVLSLINHDSRLTTFYIVCIPAPVQLTWAAREERGAEQRLPTSDPFVRIEAELVLGRTGGRRGVAAPVPVISQLKSIGFSG